MDFKHKASNIILVTFQMIMLFQETFIHSHVYACLNEKPHLDVFMKSHEWNFSYRIEMGQ
jgi:hypothetical protein